MKKILLSLIISLLVGKTIQAQSIEIMPGNAFIFTDVQFTEAFDKKYRATLFSRTRARLSYDDEKNGISFFSGAYLNYTLKSGWGGSLIGRINNFGSDTDIGIHFHKRTSTFSLFTLPSVSITDGGVYSWFSILRFRPPINERWKGYFGVELFMAFKKSDHMASTQRLRLGVSYQGLQFGLAANISELGNNFIIANDNYGIFIRKEFN